MEDISPNDSHEKYGNLSQHESAAGTAATMKIAASIRASHLGQPACGR